MPLQRPGRRRVWAHDAAAAPPGTGWRRTNSPWRALTGIRHAQASAWKRDAKFAARTAAATGAADFAPAARQRRSALVAPRFGSAVTAAASLGTPATEAAVATVAAAPAAPVR